MSVITAFLNSKEFTKLVLKGKEQSFLTPDEINDAIPASFVDYHDIDELLFKLEEINISINQVSAEEEDTETSEIDLIDETLAAMEEKELKSSSSDPVKLYLKTKKPDQSIKLVLLTAAWLIVFSLIIMFGISLWKN